MADKEIRTQVFTIVDAVMATLPNTKNVIHVTDHTGRILSRWESNASDYEMRLAHIQALKGKNVQAEVSDPEGYYPAIRSYLPTELPPDPDIVNNSRAGKPAAAGGAKGSGGGGYSKGKSADEMHATLINTCIMQARELLGSGVSDPTAAQRAVLQIATTWYIHFSEALPKGSGKGLPPSAAKPVQASFDGDIPF